jgi:opacity protein-like surface antigen
MNVFYKSALTLIVVMFALSSAYSQSDRYKWEGYGGYSYMNLNRGFDPDEFNDNFSDFPTNRVNAHGFNGSVTYNWSRFLGAKFDVTLHTHGEDFTSVFVVNPLLPAPPSGTFKTSQSVYQFMGGVQVKDNKKEGARFKPWGHILFGVADQHFSIDQTAPTNTQLLKINSTDFAMKFGGGIDYRIHKNVDVRVIQFDWNPIVRGDTSTGGQFGTINGVLQNNWLLGFGVVFH